MIVVKEIISGKLYTIEPGQRIDGKRFEVVDSVRNIEKRKAEVKAAFEFKDDTVYTQCHNKECNKIGVYEYT